MRLIVDHSSGARAVSVPCLTCGKMTRLVDCVMDLDGEAFKAYYCPKDKPKGETALDCGVLGCRRCGL